MKNTHFKAIVACALLATAFAQCAYLNTFYNARTAYNTARREHKKLLRTSPDSAETLPQRIVDLYDRAITKSLKVMEVYPKSKSWHDDAEYLMARASFYKGEMAVSVRRFRRLQREFPQSPFIPESYLYLGKAYLADDNLAKAQETFEFIMEKYPQLNAQEEVTFLLAQVAIKREGKSQAVALLEKTLKTVKTPEKKIEIILQIANLYIDLRQYRPAIDILKQAPRNKALPESLYKIDFALLLCYNESRLYEDALKLCAVMIKNRLYLRHYPEIRLQKGFVLKKTGKIDEAIDEFEQVTKGSGSPDMQGRAWYELGLIYQHEKGDFEKAKSCYTQAISLASDEDIKESAQMRSQAIGELDSYRKLLNAEITEKDSADTADSAAVSTIVDTTQPLTMLRFKMGEIFWLHLQEPDSALNHFSSVSKDTSAGDSLQNQALYARAWITLHMKADSSAADSLFHIIIRQCPASLYAKRSQAELGIPITVKTRGDSAHLAMLNAENLYYEDGNALASSRAYLKVALQYPDLDVAAQSMYAAAWLCDNALHKKVTARKLYRMLCDSFPSSDLCLSHAKPRLQIVEDTLRAVKARKKDTKDSDQRKDMAAGKKSAVTADADSSQDSAQDADEAILGEDEIGEKDPAPQTPAQPDSSLQAPAQTAPDPLQYRKRFHRYRTDFPGDPRSHTQQIPGKRSDAAANPTTSEKAPQVPQDNGTAQIESGDKKELHQGIEENYNNMPQSTPDSVGEPKAEEQVPGQEN